MRPFYIAILVVLCFFPSFARSQICSDSSFHLRYKFPDHFNALQQIILSDGGRLMEGDVQSTGSKLVCRFDKYNNAVWSKKITAEAPSLGILIYSMTEAVNGNLAMCGFLPKLNNQLDFYFAIFDQAGNLLSQKILDFPGVINFNDRYKESTLLCKKSNDSLLFMFNVDWYGNDPQKLCLISTDNNGNVGSTRIINLPSSSYNVAFVKAKVSANTLKLYGSAYHTFSCSTLNYTGAFINLEIDLTNNKVMRQKTYCLPTAGGTGFVGFSWSYHSPGAYDGYNFYHNSFFLKNGGIALTRAYQRFTTIPDTTNWLFHISYFDSSFNPVKSEYVTTGNLFQNNTVQEVLIDSLQNKYFYFTDYNLKRTYYALADSANVFQLQKKVDIASLQTNANENRLNILSGDALLSITTSSEGNSASQVDYFKILQKDVTSQCFGTDTSFLSFKPTQLYSGTWGTITVEPASYAETPAGLSIQDYQITKEVVCVKRHVCDVLDLHAPDIVCDVNQPVKITVTKNIDCEGKVIFRFDTSAVISYMQQNDTTLLLTFNKTWQGKIYASLSACPSIRDSINIKVFAQSSPLFLGRDTFLCKGTTLQLTSPAYFNQYVWQDGTTAKTFVVSSPGKYFLTATDLCGRQYSDTIRVTYSSNKLDLGADIKICKGEHREFNAPQSFSNYYWQPDYNISNVQSRSPVVFPERTTTYYAQAKDSKNCLVSDTIVVTVDTCSNSFFVPSAFTPNNDGNNDLFRPVIKGAVVNYQVSIYNRWGEQVFTTKNINAGWNGKVKSKEQTTGVYVWTCIYQFFNEQPKQAKGTVLLIF